jgi:adenine C2-methylase RlmN of 23S rRNA A2503 and tRNA A37
MNNAEQFSNAVAGTLVNLAERWEDEKEHEGMFQYQKVLQKTADKYKITITGMTGCPFGCIFNDGGFRYTLQARLTRTSATVELSSTKT